MSTMDAISLTAAPANASEIALEEDADLEELRQAQDLACPSIITILSPILTYWHRGPYGAWVRRGGSAGALGSSRVTPDLDTYEDSQGRLTARLNLSLDSLSSTGYHPHRQ